jgi:WD40 repeat protein
VFAVKYSPQGDKFMSGGMDKMIRVWSKDGELLNEIKGHDESVKSLHWSKDNAHIFSGSASSDCTIRKWRLIDGQELVVLRGHTNMVSSLCMCPHECHLISASRDCSIRIWDLKTNMLVGDPLLHDDELFALAISTDGKYIATAGADARIYLWRLDVVLRGDRAGVRMCITLAGDSSKQTLNIFQSVHDGSAGTEVQLKVSHICSTSQPTASLVY